MPPSKDSTTIIIETPSCFNGILNMIEGYSKVVAAIWLQYEKANFKFIKIN